MFLDHLFNFIDTLIYTHANTKLFDLLYNKS